MLFSYIIACLIIRASTNSIFSSTNNLLDQNCIAQITKNEFVTVVPKNGIIIPTTSTPNYVVGLNYFLEHSRSISGSNFIFYIDNAGILDTLFQKLVPDRSYILVLFEYHDTIFQLAHHYQISKLVVVLGRSTNCSFISKPQLKFTKSILKVAYLTTPPFVNDVAATTNPGVMISMFDLIAEKIGVGLHYPSNDELQDELLNNGTQHKLVKGLVQGEYDVGLGRLMMNSTIDTPFDLGPVLFKDDLVLAAPKPKKLKSYRKLFVVFELELWIKLLGTVFGIVVLSYIFGLFENFNRTSVSRVMFDIFRISLLSGINILPTRTSWRVLIIFYSIFSLCIDSIYLGKLSSIFAESSYDIQVNELKVVFMKRMTFVVNWQVERFYLLRYVLRNEPRGHEKLKIYNKTFSYLLDYVALAKENGTMVFDSLLRTNPSHATLVDTFGAGTGYMTFFVTFYLRKGQIYNEAIIFWAQEMIEKGFVTKWTEDIKWGNIKNEILLEEEKKLVVLKLAHFEESFRVLFGGYCLAFGALLLEFVFKKLELIGVVKTVKDFVVFLFGLLKPPKISRNRLN